MKLLKLHQDRLALLLNPAKLVLLLSIPIEGDGELGFKTGICTGYRANGEMIVLVIDETPEEIDISTL